MSARAWAVVIGHVLFALATYATFAMGNQYAPEIMVSPVMLYPLVMGIVGIWVWFGFWSYGVLKGGGKPGGGVNAGS